MIDLAEKIAAGVCAFLLVATSAVYFFFKFPSPVDPAWLPEVYEETPAASAPTSTPSEPSRAPAARPELQRIAERLQRQTGRLIAPGELARTEKTLTVPQPLFQMLEAEANLIPALKTAKSRPINTGDGSTRLQVFAIRENSYLQKLGFRDNDVIELLNGEIVQFDTNNTTGMYALWDQARESLRSGGTVSVTVTRENRPVHLQFRLPTQ